MCSARWEGRGSAGGVAHCLPLAGKCCSSATCADDPHLQRPPALEHSGCSTSQQYHGGLCHLGVLHRGDGVGQARPSGHAAHARHATEPGCGGSRGVGGGGVDSGRGEPRLWCVPKVRAQPYCSVRSLRLVLHKASLAASRTNRVSCKDGCNLVPGVYDPDPTVFGGHKNRRDVSTYMK